MHLLHPFGLCCEDRVITSADTITANGVTQAAASKLSHIMMRIIYLTDLHVPVDILRY